MKEPFWQKIKRKLHGTFLFPHVKRETDGIIWCTCGYRKIHNSAKIKVEVTEFVIECIICKKNALDGHVHDATNTQRRIDESSSI